MLTCAVALTHASAVIDWYFSYSPMDPIVAVLSGNTSFGRVSGFPFELFGLFALLVMVLLAATSHDFWLSFLTPPVWKALHMALYAGYLAVVLHIALGALQAAHNPLLGIVVTLCATGVAVLHVAAARRPSPAPVSGVWIVAGRADAVPEDGAIVVQPPNGEAVAIFRHDNRLSAISNLCAHQNGPLGEGRVVGGCITCPWHGFQYRLEDGCAPPPYTEKLATYNLRVVEGTIMLDPKPNRPGTRVEPVVLA